MRSKGKNRSEVTQIGGKVVTPGCPWWIPLQFGGACDRHVLHIEYRSRIRPPVTREAGWSHGTSSNVDLWPRTLRPVGWTGSRRSAFEAGKTSPQMHLRERESDRLALTWRCKISNMQCLLFAHSVSKTIYSKSMKAKTLMMKPRCVLSSRQLHCLGRWTSQSWIETAIAQDQSSAHYKARIVTTPYLLVHGSEAQFSWWVVFNLCSAAHILLNCLIYKTSAVLPPACSYLHPILYNKCTNYICVSVSKTLLF